MVEQFIAEGHDPIKIAAAALKLARVEEKRRPVEQISEVVFNSRSKRGQKARSGRTNGKGKNYRKDSQQRRGGNGNGNGNGRSYPSREEGMVRLTIERGKVHGINPGEIVGGIASRAAIPGNAIGKIQIQETHTLVDVKEDFVSRVLGQTGSYSFRDHQNVIIKRAK